MDFSKIKSEVDALLAKTAEQPSEMQAMTAEQFAEYAKDQVAKAEAAHTSGDKDGATARLTALAAEVDKISKFEFKPGELPSITVFKDTAQMTPEVVATPALESTPATSNWVAKSEDFAKMLAQHLGPRINPPAAPADPDFVWEADLAAKPVTGDVADFK